MYKIKIFNKSGEEFKSFSCSESSCKVTIGKENTNDLILSDPSVSAQHAVFEFDGEKAVIRNLKSRNGILLNSERLKKEKSMISPSDQIGIGDFNCKIEWVADGSDKQTAKGSSLKGALFTVIIIIIPLLYITYMAMNTKPVEVAEIEEFQPLEEKDEAVRDMESVQKSWRYILTKAKDAYFKDNILQAAKSFQKVLEMQPENIEARTFLEQIKKEMVPEIEKEIKSYIEERNIVSCAAAVEKLRVLDPHNKTITEADALLKGFNTFKEVKSLYETHQFRKAFEKVQKVVLVDEETLSDWRNKIEREVKFTEKFKNAIIIYRNGPITEALNAMKDVMRTATSQKKLISYTRQKLKILGSYFRFKKLEKQDPLKQTAFGVGLYYGLSETEDPFIYGIVKNKLDELKKVCGPGTSFYDLLETDTSTQLAEARNYKGINEYEFALRNYTKALNGLRILSFFSKELKFRKQSDDAYQEIMDYHIAIQEKIEAMRKINEFEGANSLERLVKKYEIIKPSEVRETILNNAESLIEDEDLVLYEILNPPAAPVEEKKEESADKTDDKGITEEKQPEEAIDISFN